MKYTDCPFEPEILRVAVEGRWPESCPPDLREHVAACPNCADLVGVASAVAEDRAAAIRQVRLPSAGLVWWKMQTRRRRETELALQRTTFALQAAMLIVALGAAAILLRFATIPSVDWLSSLLHQALHTSTPILVVALAWLGLAPVAAWLALGHD